MYQKMLVPLDGSELAEVVFTYAKELAGRLGLEAILLHIGTPEEKDFIPMRQAYIERAAETVKQQVQEVQQRQGVKPGVKPAGVRGELTEGYAAEEILRYVEENGIDLILMATHGLTGSKRWTVGHVTDKVLRASKVPVWLVRAGAPDEVPYDKWPKKTLLVPLDGSEMAESVLPHIERLAKQTGPELVEVVLLRICEPPLAPSYYVPEFAGASLNWGEYIQQEVAACKHTAKEYLIGIEQKLKDAGVSVQSEVPAGKAADEIVDYANKSPFNIIVMATHGRSGISRWVYGSVAENVLRDVSCPLFLVRPR